MARRQQKANIESQDDANKPVQDDWLKRAASAWEVSDSYYTTNLEARIVRNQHLFDSKHPPGSKYTSDAYKYRSKVFRPKVRTAIRKTEAGAVAAFFSTIDAIAIEPENPDDMQGRMAADLAGAALKHHLTNTIPWYLTCIGGVQDAAKVGVVCSFNHWKRKVNKFKVTEPVFGPDGQQALDEKGNPVEQTREEEEVIEDRPDIELFPFNYLRFHPAAQWVDPMNTSPFVCRIIPMYVCDIKARMREETPDSDKWVSLTDGEIKAAKINTQSDAQRQASDKGRQNPLEVETPGTGDYDMSIVLHWFMLDPKDGKRHEFYTLGTKYRLSSPTPIRKRYPHGKTPITYGFMVLEAHRNMPVGMPELGEQLQKEANDLANARLDNLKLAINKRYIVKRGSQTDVRSLTMNAPGAVTFSTKVEDVLPLEFNDVSAGAYQEQSRIDNDSDEILGNFSQSSIQSNRSMNETVGGLQMLQSTTGQTTDYNLKTFVETWMEPTLRQILSLIQYYETDKKVINMAAAKAQMGQKYGPQGDQPMMDPQGQPMMDQAGKPMPFEPKAGMMEGNVRLTVNVGVGASNPAFKAQQFIAAVKQFVEILVMAREAQLTSVQAQEIARELFGYIGYKDGSRFFKLDEQGQIDPNVQALQAELQKAQQIIESKQVETQGKLEIERLAGAQKTASERRQREHEDTLNQRDNATKLKVALLQTRRDKEKQNIERDKIRAQRDMNRENNDTTKETAKMSAAAAKSKPKKKAA